MRARATFALALAAAMTAGAAQADGWRHYVNARYGATADVPAAWREDPPPADGDGRGFTSPDGRGHVAVFGQMAIRSFDGEVASRTRARVGETVTYLDRGATWFVVS
ncbi:MAG: hypothetical protein KGQ28_07575, partial [Hyphomicrobiales bacterium]|nr:hypothetical protein [Hyphomicrobiales bacterium]